MEAGQVVKRLAKIVVVVAVVLVGLYYTVVTPSVSLRYRLTVKVDVNGVAHTGSGVVEVTYQTFRDWVITSVPFDWASRFRGSVKGYAITVNLGDRGLLFVVNKDSLIIASSGRPSLMGGPALDELPFYAYRSIFPRDVRPYPTNGPLSEVMDRAHMIRDAKKEPRALAAKDLPMMVRFTDINNPNSGEEVDPRDLAATVGPGVRLERVTFELTRDPVTPMPSIWPAWLKAQSDAFLPFTHQRLGAFPFGKNGVYASEFKGGL